MRVDKQHPGTACIALLPWAATPRRTSTATCASSSPKATSCTPTRSSFLRQGSDLAVRSRRSNTWAAGMGGVAVHGETRVRKSKGAAPLVAALQRWRAASSTRPPQQLALPGRQSHTRAAASGGLKQGAHPHGAVVAGGGQLLAVGAPRQARHLGAVPAQPGEEELGGGVAVGGVVPAFMGERRRRARAPSAGGGVLGRQALTMGALRQAAKPTRRRGGCAQHRAAPSGAPALALGRLALQLLQRHALRLLLPARRGRLRAEAGRSGCGRASGGRAGGWNRQRRWAALK